MSIPAKCFQSFIRLCNCDHPPPKFNTSLPVMVTSTLTSRHRNHLLIYSSMFGLLILVFMVLVFVWKIHSRIASYSFGKTPPPDMSVVSVVNGIKKQ